MYAVAMAIRLEPTTAEPALDCTPCRVQQIPQEYVLRVTSQGGDAEIGAYSIRVD